MVPLFKSLVRPILEYGNAAWVPCLIKNITCTENVQRRFTKRITGMNNLEYEQRLLVLKKTSLEYRRARGDMIETLKIILYGYHDHETVCSLFKLNESAGTRGHPFKLHKKTVLTNQYAHFFSNSVINNWNSLPSNIVLAGTLNSLKNTPSS